MEVTTQVPQTGTKLHIDADRGFDGPSGDSVLRIKGQNQEGSQTFDASYVEVDGPSAQVIAQVLRQIKAPTPELQSEIAREVQATFGDKLGGRDAQQVATIVARAWSQRLIQQMGLPQQQAEQHLDSLAERFERTAAQRRQQPAYSGQGQQPQGQGQGQYPGQGQGR